MGAEPYNPYNLAATLAHDLVTAGMSRLRELNFSPEEIQALRRTWEAAFEDLLTLEQFRPKPGVVLPEDAFREFVGAEGAADALLDLVVEERPPRLELLGRRFETIIKTTAAAPVDFKEALATLTRGLIRALATEAREPGSLPGRRVSILRPAAIHSLLKEPTDTPEEIAAKVTRLEQRVPPQTKYNVIFLGQAAGTVIGDDARVRQEFGPLLEHTLADIKEIAASSLSLNKGINTLVELLGGISGISADYAGRIKNFLIEYLGTQERPVPFGGRQEQLTDLDKWLTSTSATPYCLIAAEAGRGKSALLARWADSLVSRGVARVVFIPISIRFNTASAEVTFTALAARLSEVYGDPVKWASLTSQQWREICLKYMSLSPPDNTPLLIILDGLDEASDWRPGPDLFPLAPPPGIRIVVSARYLAGDVDERGWLHRLRWDAGLARNLPLPTLTRAGVSEVLAAMGNPLDRLATQVDVIGELFRLSQGDPLLVRLYVEALLPYGSRAAAIRSEDLPSIQEGLAGYFERWWEDQRSQWEAQRRNEVTEKEDVLKFLNVCASALGPLTREDIAAVAGGNLTSGLRIKTVAADVSRFVIGDGVERGYVFGHPRLGYFFWDQMTEQERAGWEESFLNYGRKTLESLNSSRLSPGKAPAYALRYYGAHLERAKAQPESLWELVSEGWLRAWYALEGSYAGFLNDTDRAWRAAETFQTRRGGGASSDAMAVLFRSALCHASVTALSVGIPTRLLGLAKEYGVLTPLQALVLARQIPDEKVCADALAAVAQGMPEWMQEDVLAAVQRFENEATRAWTLGQLAPHLSDGLRKLAGEHARSFLNPRARALALCELAPHLPEEAGGLALGEAFVAVKEIEDVRVRSRTLSHLAAHLPPASPLVSDLLKIAQAAKDSPSRARALTSLLPFLTSPGREEILASARRAATQAPDHYSRALLLARLAPFLDESGREEVMSSILSDIRSSGIDEERVTGLMSLIAPYLPQRHLESAVEWTSGRAWTRKSTAPDEDRLRERILTRLEPIREKLGIGTSELTHLLGTIIQVGPNETDVESFDYEPGLFLLNFLKPEDALRLTNEQTRELFHAARVYQRVVGAALERTVRIPPRPSSLAPLLRHLSPHTRDEVCANVLGGADVWEPDTQAQIVATLADYLPHHLTDEAIGRLKLLDPSYEQVRAFARLLPRLPEGERETLTPRLTEAAAGLANEVERVRALTELAALPPEALSETRRKEVLRKALEEAQAIQDTLEAAQFRVSMARAVSDERHAAAMGAALEQISQLQDSEAFASLLQDFLPAVPESVAGRTLEVLLTRGSALAADTRVKFVLDLFPRLTETQRRLAVEELLAGLKAGPRPQQDRAWLAGELFAHLPPGQARAMLEEARTDWSAEEYLALVVKASRQHMTDDMREAMLSVVLQRVGELLAKPRGPGLIVQALNSQPQEFQSALAEGLWKAINSASTLIYPWTKVEFSLRLLRHLGEPSREQLIRELLTGTESLADYQWAEVCRSLARFTPPDLLPDAFERAMGLWDKEYKMLALSPLIPHLNEGLRERALNFILDAAGQLIHRFDVVAKTLSGVAPYIPEAEKSEFARGTLRTMAWLDWGFGLEAHHLRALGPFLTEDCLVDALSFVRSSKSRLSKVEAYTLLYPRLPQALRDETLKEALTDISGLTDRHALTTALAHLGPVLPDETWKARALEVALKVADGISRVRALKALTPFLPDRLKVRAMSDALEAVNNMQERGPRTVELMSLVAHLPPDGGLLQEGMKAVLGLRYNERLPSLRALAPRLAAWAGAQPEPARRLWNECLRVFSQHPRPAFFNEMNAMLPFTLALAPEAEKDDAILGVLRAGEDVVAWWP
ncbi:MAG TPA: ATP-binding protein [Pyrinomonadaceae bacterium]